jgi:hypothetical protein
MIFLIGLVCLVISMWFTDLSERYDWVWFLGMWLSIIVMCAGLWRVLA